jgi:competence protein ComEC
VTALPAAQVDGARLDVRLVPAALAAWTVTASGILWGGGGAACAALVCVGLTAGGHRWVARRVDGVRALAAVGAVAVVAAGFSVAITLRVHQLDRHPVTTLYGGTADVLVTPTESPRTVAGGRLMFRGTLGAIGPHASSGRVVVFASGTAFGDVAAGRPMRFSARIGRPLRRDLTVGVLSARGPPTLGRSSPIQDAAQQIRVDFGAVARAALPPDQAAMVPALVLGDTSTLSGRVVDDFRTAGLTHLTAVSGANVTIVCGAVLLSAGLVGPRAAVALAALVLLGFVILVQPSASVLRAALMGAVTLLAVVSHRRRQAIPALGATVIALMVGAPELAVDVGFALSVAATAGLVVLAPMWSRRLVGRGWPKLPADAVSVAVAAQVVTAPLVAGISGRFSIVAVVANLVVAVVIAPITVIGTAAAGLCALWPAGAQFLIRFTGPEVWWLLAVARWAAGVPGASVPVPSGAGGVAVVGGTTLAVVAAVVWWRWRCGRVSPP